MGKSRAITAADRERFYMLRLYGCAACRKLGVNGHHPEIHPPEIHHLVEGYRLGHEYTIPLCVWHHRGERENLDVSMDRMRHFFGPSMAREKKAFIKEFGSERELLMEVNKWLDQNPIKEGEQKGLRESENFFPF